MILKLQNNVYMILTIGAINPNINVNTRLYSMSNLIYGQLLSSSSSWVSKTVRGAAKLIVQVIFTPHLINEARLILRSISYHQCWKIKHKTKCHSPATFGLTFLKHRLVTFENLETYPDWIFKAISNRQQENTFI